MNAKKNFFRKILPVIFGIKGFKISKKEREFFLKSNPLGFILFERNCKNSNQVKSLTKELKKTTSHKHTMIMIDQEGGRVARLKKPNFNSYPNAEFFGIIAENNIRKAKKHVLINSIMIGQELKKLGINMNCAPVLDVKYNFTNDVIGDRSFSHDPKIVSELGMSFCKGLKKKRVVPIIKHIPGHGSSKKDSHKTTPVVDLDLSSLNNKDFIPFKKLNKEVVAMVSHIIYSKIDKKVACYSKKIIKNIIKKKIGFKGLLISDDINMKALKGSINHRVVNILESGCDIILHCNANLKEMKQITSSIPYIKNSTLKKVSKLKDLV
ncbi:MAG: Beta-hexosaminidase [Alphaproteobacteria bacterium MarineAlpha6_Bin3]|nr:MAG: Beta-hexosaminidase [Alphaproteobacteria bacterium MarineAlpha6_Bin3]